MLVNNNATNLTGVKKISKRITSNIEEFEIKMTGDFIIKGKTEIEFKIIIPPKNTVDPTQFNMTFDTTTE